MNTTSLAKSMNGVLSVTDGEITMENGDITFSDGSVLSSIGDIALKSADNVMTGDNTFNNNITMGAEIPTSTFHLTNKSYVDDSIAQETLSILAGNNTFTGINTFSNKLITTDISNNGLINDLTIGRWGDELGSIIFGETTAKKTGIFNTIIGTNTFINNTTGSLNTTLGHSVLRLNTTGEANTATGDLSLYSNTTGSNNTGDGFGALFSNTIGGKNSAIGYYSGTNQKTGNNNTFLGSNTQVASLTQTYNNSTAIGYNSSIDASNQIVMGTANEYVKIPSTKASSDYTTGALVVAGGVGIAGNLRVNGRCIFNDILSAYNDVYFSTNLIVNQTITVNTDLTVYGNTTLTSNLNVGGIINSLKVKGSSNSLIITGLDGTLNLNNLTGVHNYIIGSNNYNLQSTSSVYNVGLGTNIGSTLTSGNFNVGIGVNVLAYATSASLNVSLGHRSLQYLASGDNNVSIGYVSGKSTDEVSFYKSSNNTFLGSHTNFSTDCSYSTAVGYGSTITSNNQVVLGRGVDYVSIPSTTATTASTNGALVVAGGIGVAGKVISNSEIQASSFYSPAGTLSVGGLSYLNGGVSIPASKTIRWTAGDMAVESYYADNDRYGLSYTSGITRLHTSSFYPTSGIRFSLATGVGTYTDLMTIAHNGDTIVPSLTDSTNTSTGAFKVSGGAAVSKSLSVGRNLTVGDNFTMSSGIINVISTGLGEVGLIIATFVDFYTFPDKGVYIFYINRCNTNGVGVLSSEALDANTSKTLMITMGTIGMVIFNMGSTNGYINIIQGTTDRKLTAQITNTAFNYTYWWHRLF